jgi:ferredoxin
MQLLIIDQEKCKKDGICAGECPMAIIKLKDGKGFPEVVSGGEDICNNCGHCVAFCPLSHDGRLSKAEVYPPARAQGAQNYLEVTAERTRQSASLHSLNPEDGTLHESA